MAAAVGEDEHYGKREENGESTHAGRLKGVTFPVESASSWKAARPGGLWKTGDWCSSGVFGLSILIVSDVRWRSGRGR
jgi:hypothetical protein